MRSLPVVVRFPHRDPERDCEPAGQPQQLVDADRATAQGTDALDPVEAGVAQVDVGAAGVREVGGGEVGAVEVHAFQPRAAEIGACAIGRLEPHLLEVRATDVRVVEAAIGDRDMTPLHEAELEAGRPALVQQHAMESTFGEVAARDVAAHELDVDEPGAGEVLPRVPGSDDARAHQLAVLVELQPGEFWPVGRAHAAILAADVVTSTMRLRPRRFGCDSPALDRRCNVARPSGPTEIPVARPSNGRAMSHNRPGLRICAWPGTPLSPFRPLDSRRCRRVHHLFRFRP